MPSATQKLTMFRTASRYLTEPHPFARNPVTMKSHAVNYSIYPKRVARAGALFVPGALIILGWPFAAEMYGRKVGM
ncbi:hypothetical protein P171DRAFT_437218 [Karstenula rhodostoma CBS 690.94]|uniref:Uncharacterized protein n=1 Tax=Karstenula rhodostoma CBS 690.94 TaxID=1392251 RepID=A0A9P4P4E0_9PLEO|nr:hypothetical protein P171DRAFT_437218 [Karstenula rhodostoma CBS 690.94]